VALRSLPPNAPVARTSSKTIWFDRRILRTSPSAPAARSPWVAIPRGSRASRSEISPARRSVHHRGDSDNHHDETRSPSSLQHRQWREPGAIFCRHDVPIKTPRVKNVSPLWGYRQSAKSNRLSAQWFVAAGSVLQQGKNPKSGLATQNSRRRESERAAQRIPRKLVLPAEVGMWPAIFPRNPRGGRLKPTPSLKWRVTRRGSTTVLKASSKHNAMRTTHAKTIGGMLM